ncbi:MAG: hypothetical protein M3R04_02130 [bacterium]|nr:hypothetical protein [bacterium]
MEDHQQHQPDAWEPGSDADIHVSSIVFIGVIGAVMTLVIVLLLKALYYQTLNAEVVRKQGKTVDVTLSDLRSSQLLQLHEYRWVDARAGQVGIPIDKAMELVVAEQGLRPYNGIEILDWDNHHSDMTPTPGNMVLLGQGAGFTSAPVLAQPAPEAAPYEKHALPDMHSDTTATGEAH